MLEISKDDQDKVSAVHNDSKGFLSKIMYALGLYSLAPIRDAVTKHFQGSSLTTQCHGHQGIRDDVNCGRFILGYIDQKSVSHNEVLSNPSSKFTEIQQKINTPSQDQRIKSNSRNSSKDVLQRDTKRHTQYLDTQKQSQSANRSSIKS